MRESAEGEEASVDLNEESPEATDEYAEVTEIASAEEADVTEPAEDVAECDEASFMRPDDTLEKE